MGKQETRELPYIPDLHRPVIERVLAVSPICTTSILGNEESHGIYCGMTGEALFFAAYPCLENPPLHKGKRSSNCKFFGGSSNPKHIFTALRKAFETCYPTENESRVSDWEIWKCNVAFYGEEFAKASCSWASHYQRMYHMRHTGGPMQTPSVNMGKELSIKRAELAVSVKCLYPATCDYDFASPDVPVLKYTQARERASQLKIVNDKGVSKALLNSEKAVEEMDI